ncbi:MAG: OmpA family protein [Pyrinomonadaceae bacterium]
MNFKKSEMPRLLASSAFGLLLLAAPAFAQDTGNTGSATTNTTSTTQSTSSGSTQSDATAAAKSRTVSNGEKIKLKGVVTRRDADTFSVRDLNGVDTTVRLTDTTRIVERKGNPFRRAKNYGATNILRGLNVEVEGRGDASGQLVADNVKFSEDELKVARTVESRVNPVENRVGENENRIGQVEQNAQRLSGQIDELAAVSNAAKGGARAAQETADAAVSGVNATNERISALDDYVPQDMTAVNFRPGSAVLSPQAKAQLDQLATKAFTAKGYVIEVSGYADTTGSTDLNRRLSQQRADSVVRYLAEQHRIPLRRIITPFGYGESQAIADNQTRQGRAQNRRVEVKVLVNRGLLQTAPTMTTPSSTTPAQGSTSGSLSNQ